MNSNVFVFGAVGHYFIKVCAKIGHFVLFVMYSMRYLIRPRFYTKLICQQLLNIGFFSIPIVGMTAVFSGAVLAFQTYYGFSRFNAESVVAIVVILSITRELGPVLTGLMVSGRISSSIAAEIGTMQISEQVDALKTLSVNPFNYLVSPRIIAGLIAMPILTLIADIIGVFGGFLVSVYVLGFEPNIYINNSIEFLERIDVVSGLIKSLVFGYIIVIVGAYFGYNAKFGVKSVGEATTNSVVFSSILILLSNLLITKLIFG